MCDLKDITIISYILQEDIFYDVSCLGYLQSIFLCILNHKQKNTSLKKHRRWETGRVIKGTIVRVVFSVTHDMVDGRVASVEGAVSKKPHNCTQ